MNNNDSGSIKLKADEIMNSVFKNALIGTNTAEHLSGCKRLIMQKLNQSYLIGYNRAISDAKQEGRYK